MCGNGELLLQEIQVAVTHLAGGECVAMGSCFYKRSRWR